MAPKNTDGAPMLYQVVYEPSVPARMQPDRKSVMITTLDLGEVLTTHAWDSTRHWRCVIVENDAGEEQEAWVQAFSDDSQFLRELGPVPCSVDQCAAAADSLDTSADGLDTSAQTTSVRGHRSHEGRFCSMLKDKGLKLQPEIVLRSSARDDPAIVDAANELPARSSVGQRYRVVFRPRIPVREYPSMTATVLRAAAYGDKVTCYEWDRTRNWRRVIVERQVDDDSHPKGYCNLTISDGWVRITHPNKGSLLEAVLDDEIAVDDSTVVAELHDEKIAVDDRSNEDQGFDGQTAVQEPELEDNDPRKGFTTKLIDDSDAWDPPPSKQELEAQKRCQEDHEINDILNSVEDRSAFSEPSIMRAARAGSFKVVDRLLRRFADPNAADTMGETALFEAAGGGYTDIVGHLLVCKAETRVKSLDGFTVLSVTKEPATVALLQKWQGLQVDEELFAEAYCRLASPDQKRLAQLLGIVAPNASPEPKQLEEKPNMQGDEADQVAATRSDLSALPSSKGVARGSSDHEELRLEERGAPKRVETPTLYRVVYKMVAVRQQPDSNSQSLRGKKAGDIVEMFEWDSTRRWRRVRVQVSDGEGVELITTDAWMLIHSDTLGPLLVPDTDEDDEFAG